MKLTFERCDMANKKNDNNFKQVYLSDDKNIVVLSFKNYRTIKFKYLNDDLINIIKNELSFFLDKIKKKRSVLIVGLGNDNLTADSIGPKVLKGIKVNAHLIKMGLITNEIKVSSLEPGVLGETGIDTTKIIKSVTKEIKPDFLIIIDSFITDDINSLEKIIQINNKGITPGSGIYGVNSKINQKNIGVPIIVIGVPTALEATIKNNKYILSTNNIDKYVIKISKIISKAINNILHLS